MTGPGLRRAVAVVAALVATCVAGPGPTTGAASAAPAPSAVVDTSAAAAPDWQGDRQAMPAAYSWLDDHTPTDTYTVVLVRGIGVKAALRTLGPVEKQLRDKTPRQAENYVFDHSGSTGYDWPRVAQVARRGHAVWIYLPYDFLPDDLLARLSRRGVAAGFSTTVELDTYVTVAKDGRVVRHFDAGFQPPATGALPAEQGLDWGARRQNIFATAWAFNERLTRTHVSREWFERTHPTYVLERLS